MLPKKNRLVKNEDFLLVKKKGINMPGKKLSIVCLKTSVSEPRVGIIVSTKISKKAAERNRIKRLIRRAVLEKIKKIKGYDVVVLSKRGVVDASYEEIRKDIEGIVSKLD